MARIHFRFRFFQFFHAPFLIIGIGVFAFLGFQFIAYAADFGPKCLPPDCQPDSGGTGTASTLLDVLAYPNAFDVNGDASQGFNGNIGLGADARIGIGTKEPGYALDVLRGRGNGTAIVRLGSAIITNNDTKAYTGLRLDRNENNTSTEKWFLGMSDTTDSFIIRRAGVTNDIEIDSSGIVHAQCVGPMLEKVTQATFTGLVTDGNKVGYDAANAKCGAGYHVCTTEEVLKTFQCKSSKFSEQEIANKSAWINNGPPGFTAQANDCVGWATDDFESLGAYWSFDGSGGSGWADTCDIPHRFACCK